MVGYNRQAAAESHHGDAWFVAARKWFAIGATRRADDAIRQGQLWTSRSSQTLFQTGLSDGWEATGHVGAMTMARWSPADWSLSDIHDKRRQLTSRVARLATGPFTFGFSAHN